MTPAHDLISSTLFTELSQLHKSLGFLQKRNFLECQKAEVSLYDAVHNFFYSYWAFPLINPVVVLVPDWPFYII